MKLLVISSAFPPFAAPEAAHTLFLCEGLAERSLDVHLLTSCGNGATRSLLNGLTIHPTMPDWGWRGLSVLKNAFRKIRPDVILLVYIDWIYRCHPMVTLAPVVARRLIKQTLFVTLFENENGLSHVVRRPRWRSSFVQGVAGLWAGTRDLDPSYGALLRDSDRILTLSEQHLQAFELAYPGVRKRATIIPAPMPVKIRREEEVGANRPHGRRLLGISEEELVVIFFGFVYPLKDIETLIVAFARLPFGARLVMVGGFDPGPYSEELRRLSRDLGVDGRIAWLGYCEDDRASLYLQSADVAVLLFREGVRMNNSSLAVVAAHGLPIITTRGKTLEAPFVDGENVRLCPPRDSEAVSVALADLLRHPAKRAHLASGARRLAKEFFAPDRAIDSILNVLTSKTSRVMNEQENSPVVGKSRKALVVATGIGKP